MTTILLTVLVLGCAGAVLMPLARQTVPLLLRGLSQKAPNQVAAQGELDALLNMAAQKGDTSGFEFFPRAGVSFLSRTADSGSISTGMKLATLGTGLVLLTGTACYRKALDQWHLADANVPTVGVTSTPIVANSVIVSSTDSAYVNGYTVSAAVNQGPTGSVQVLVTDANGATVLNTTISSGVRGSVRVIVSGTLAVIFYEGLPSNLLAAKFDSAAPSSISSFATITTAANVNFFVYDAQTVPSTGNIAVCWNNAGTGNLNQALLNPTTMAVSGLTAYATLNALLTFAYLTNTFSSNDLYIGHVDGANGLRVTTFNGTTLALGATTVFDAASTSATSIAGYRAGASVTVFFTQDGVTAYDARIRKSTGAAATTVIRSLALTSRVLSANGTLYATGIYRGTGQGTLFLLDLGTGKPIGKVFPDVANTTVPVHTDQLPNLAVGATATTWLTAGLRNIAVLASSGLIGAYTGASSIAFTYQDTTVGGPVELNGALHIPGALPYLFDGAVVVEEGFPIAPEQSDAPVVAAGGGLTASSTYTYRYVYEWTDATGAIHRSAPNLVPQQVILAALQTRVTLALPTLRVTRKTNVAIAVYRTPSNGDGSVYYKVSSVTAPTLNDTTVDRVAFVDNIADTALVGNEPLYTNGNILENISPPPSRSMAVHRGRLLVGGIDGDPTAVWFSKDVVPGFGVSFSDGLVSRLNSATELVTAVGSMDAYAIACTASTTWASADEYPDDTGSGGVLRFNQYSSTVGCTGADHLARTDQGIMLWGGTPSSTAPSGAKGPWRLSRGLTFDYVGSAIEDDAATLTPKAVIAVPTLNQVRYVMGSSSGVVLVYETIFGTWAKWSYLDNGAPYLFVDGVVWSGAMAYLDSGGTVYPESASLLTDAGQGVSHSITLGMLRLGGPGGFARFYAGNLTGAGRGAGAFTMRVAQTIDGISISTRTHAVNGTDPALDLEFEPGSFGKCTSLVLTVSDDATPGTGFTLAAVTLDVGSKPGLDRKPPARVMT